MDLAQLDLEKAQKQPAKDFESLHLLAMINVAEGRFQNAVNDMTRAIRAAEVLAGIFGARNGLGRSDGISSSDHRL